MSDAHRPLHLVTQRGQPHGSSRRCCEVCGAMCWPPGHGPTPASNRGIATLVRWTDDLGAWEAHAQKCVAPVPAPGQITEAEAIDRVSMWAHQFENDHGVVVGDDLQEVIDYIKGAHRDE